MKLHHPLEGLDVREFAKLTPAQARLRLLEINWEDVVATFARVEHNRQRGLPDFPAMRRPRVLSTALPIAIIACLVRAAWPAEARRVLARCGDVHGRIVALRSNSHPEAAQLRRLEQSGRRAVNGACTDRQLGAFATPPAAKTPRSEWLRREAANRNRAKAQPSRRQNPHPSRARSSAQRSARPRTGKRAVS